MSSAHRYELCFLYICTATFLEDKCENLITLHEEGINITLLKGKTLYLMGINDCLVPHSFFLLKENCSVIPVCDLN